MTLFVSNPSRQQVEFHFRTGITRDSSGPIVAVIPSGGQVELGHGWTREQMDYVVKQIEMAGGGNAALAHGAMGKFTGLLYRESHPVDEDEILTANGAVEQALAMRSVEQATRSAVAFDRIANKNQGRQKGRLAKSTTVEIEQELPPHAHRTGDEVAFSLTVDPDGRADVRVPGL